MMPTIKRMESPRAAPCCEPGRPWTRRHCVSDARARDRDRGSDFGPSALNRIASAQRSASARRLHFRPPAAACPLWRGPGHAV